MKIGVLTFHYALNYGAILQAYATCRFLEGLGHNAEIIDYRNPTIEAGYKSFFWSKKALKAAPFQYTWRFFPDYFRRLSRAKSFRRFVIERMNVSFMEEDYDAILIGSDQVWNKQITNGYDEYYWADFQTSAKKIAWCASMNVLGLQEPEQIQKRLKNFDALSVREDSLKDMLQPLTDQPISVLQDPVLLLSAKEWSELAEPYSNFGKPYVLAYPMLYEEEVLRRARQLADEKGMDLIVISKNAGHKPYKGLFQCAGPEDFISFIRGASHIVTSSFHGVAFSLIYGKPYEAVVAEGERNPRIESLIRHSGDLPQFKQQAIEFLKKALGTDFDKKESSSDEGDSLTKLME